jgi:hypothetical protein
MARLNTRSFPGYCGSSSAERGVASVLRSAAVKKVVPILSTRVEKVFLTCSHLKFEKSTCSVYND